MNEDFCLFLLQENVFFKIIENIPRFLFETLENGQCD